MAQNYVNIRQIADNIQMHPLLSNTTFESIVRYTVDFMRIMGVPDIFIDKIECLELQNYRIALPCDFLEMIQVKSKEGIVYRYSTDSFHMQGTNTVPDLTYKLQGNILYSSVKEGAIYVAYRSIAVDDEGYPLLPDNASFLRALEMYIKKQSFTILFDLGKIAPAILQNIQQEYSWAAGDCQSEFNRLSIDKMQSLTNMVNRLLIKNNEFENGFKNLGKREQIKVH